MKIFDKDCRELFDSLKRDVEYKINSDNLLNFETNEYIESLCSKSKIEFSCELNLSEMSRGELEEFARGNVDHFGRSYNQKMIKCTFYVPVVGTNLTIIKYAGWSTTTLGYSCLENTNFNEKTEVLEITVEKPIDSNVNLKDETEKVVNQFNRRLPWLKKDIDDYNKQIIDFIKQKFDIRLNQLNKIKQSDDEIGLPLYVPIKRETVQIRRETIPVSSSVSVNASEIEKYYLDDKSFKEINIVIHNFAKAMESYPKSYSGFTEEMIRDQLLVTLNQVMPNDSSITGETFNKIGKTDVMIKHKNDIVFVAECKKWAGYLSLKNAIDQLRGYLTWRNNRASVIVFSYNKNFKAVLKEIEENILDYPNLVKKEITFDSNAIISVDINDGEKYLKMTIQVFNLYSGE